MIFAQALKELNKQREDVHELHVSEDGTELMDSLQNPPPTPKIIFLDLNMPGKDGRETLKDIKSNNKFNGIPVVIFSTSSRKEDVDYTHDHGANLYINKPSDYDSLKKVIARCLDIDWDKHRQPRREEFLLSA